MESSYFVTDGLEYQYASCKFCEEYRPPVTYYYHVTKIEKYFSLYLEFLTFLK